LTIELDAVGDISTGIERGHHGRLTAWLDARRTSNAKHDLEQGVGDQ
jgi:hypothetical protein